MLHTRPYFPAQVEGLAKQPLFPRTADSGGQRPALLGSWRGRGGASTPAACGFSSAACRRFSERGASARVGVASLRCHGDYLCLESAWSQGPPRGTRSRLTAAAHEPEHVRSGCKETLNQKKGGSRPKGPGARVLLPATVPLLALGPGGPPRGVWVRAFPAECSC